MCVKGGCEWLSGMGAVGVQVRTFQEEEELTQICRGKKEYSIFRLEQRAQPTRSMLRVGVGGKTSEVAQGWVRRGRVHHTAKHL